MCETVYLATLITVVNFLNSSTCILARVRHNNFTKLCQTNVKRTLAHFFPPKVIIRTRGTSKKTDRYPHYLWFVILTIYWCRHSILAAFFSINKLTPVLNIPLKNLQDRKHTENDLKRARHGSLAQDLTCREVERQSDAPGVREGQQIPVGRQQCQLLETLTGTPYREVVTSVVGLQRAQGHLHNTLAIGKSHSVFKQHSL